MTRTKWYAPFLFVALSVGGCGTSPPVHYYDLEALETGYVSDGEAYLRVGVGPLRTPDYLSRSQIVTRGGDSRVIVDDFNRWVEPVSDAVYRVVAENLDSLIDDAVVVAFPYTHIANLDYQLVGRISRFDADADGTVVLQIQWSVISAQDEFIVQPRRARYEARATRAGDYPALVRAMNEVLQQFSRDVAKSLDSVDTP
ncbi:MAG TPA: PqiC family protein [Woeseiaceae bacterium]|nr:PqiC family protein [Woeseiaceae bacterium]